MKPIIIGAGLSGLTLAWLFKKQGIEALVLEASDRPGGRILTTREEGSLAGVEMGATWLGTKHRALWELITELGLEVEEQFLGIRAIYEPISTSPPQLVSLPPNPQPSYRIKGGTDLIIKVLIAKLGKEQVLYNKRAENIKLEGDQITVCSEDGELFGGTQVFCTLPPNLWKCDLNFDPVLPSDILDIAGKTHTWMGESIKIGLVYDEAFWKEENTSGTIFSNVGPLSEFYDHSNEENNFHAIKGFLSSSYQITSSEVRRKVVLEQLARYYGDKVYHFRQYLEKVWSEERLTYVPYDKSVLPHQNNGNPIFRNSYWNGKLFFGGSETATQFPGYMDGAVQSALTLSQIR